MRRILVVGIVAALAAGGAARASEKEAKEILERAIKAHGGAAAMARAARCKRTDTGTLAVQTRQVPFVSQVARELPDRVRLEVEVDKSQKSVIVLDGDKGYQNDGGSTVALLPQRVKELREEAYIDWVVTLAPLLKDGFTLTALSKAKVGGEAVVGVKAARKGMPDVSLYFLERNGLLAKAEWRGTLAGLAVDKERLYSGYKDFDGVKVPTKETSLINNRKFSEFTISDVTFPAKLEAKTFAKP